jgi:hypothetical protein
MDFMHFQIPRKLAEILAATNKQEGEVIWNNHLLITKWYLKLKKKLAAINKEKATTIWIEHLNKCQFDGGYLSAANNKESTLICIEDCKKKVNIIDKIWSNKARHKHK